jgi:hypothetical protein
MIQRVLPVLLALLVLAFIGTGQAVAQTPLAPPPLIDAAAGVEHFDFAPVSAAAGSGYAALPGARLGGETEPAPALLAPTQSGQTRWGITGLMIGGAVGLGAGVFLCGFAAGMTGSQDRSRELGCAAAFGLGGAALGGIVGASVDLVR